MNNYPSIERLDGEPSVSIVELGVTRSNGTCFTYSLVAEQVLNIADGVLESVRLDHVRLRGSP